MNKVLLTAAVFTISLHSLYSKEDVGKTSTQPKLGSVGCAASSSKVELDINNVRTLLLNGGDMWWDQGGTGNARYEIPKLNDPNAIKKHSMFAGSVWIGGKDAATNTVMVTSETYRQGSQSYWPGPLVYTPGSPTLPEISANDCLFWDKHFKINKEEIDNFINDFNEGLIAIEEDIPEAIRTWPAKGNPYIDNPTGVDMNRNLAPFVDVNNDEIYDPLQGDYPKILGDQSIWWVMNDVGNDKVFGGSTYSINDRGIGLELETMAFGFRTNDAINNMTFYKQTLTNKGFRTLKEAYLAQWADPDLGNYIDDYVGCDVGRGLGICYNGDDDDDGVIGYGLNPPAVGIDFFKGPKADENDGIDNNRNGEIDEEGELIVMSSFIYYNNNNNPINGNPSTIEDFYNYLQAKWRNGGNVTFDYKDGINQSAPKTSFMFPGTSDQELYWATNGVPHDPWDEVIAGNSPGDRRFIQSAGPFTLSPGQVNDVVIGVVWCRSGSGGATGSLACLLAADDLAQKLFDKEFKQLQGPNSPDVAVTELNQEVVLAIVPDTFFIEDINGILVKYNTENYQEVDKALYNQGADEPNYKFQGYLVYQLSGEDVSPADISNIDKARLIAQCDIQDGVTKLINMEYSGDEDIGNIPVVKTQGDDKGVFHTISIKKDYFATGDDKLTNFKKYYYMVLAYGYNVDPLNTDAQFLLGSKNTNIVTAIPRIRETGGTVFNAGYGTGIDLKVINGTGSGGAFIDYNAETVSEILANDSIDEPVYAGGGAPINVKVYDPANIKAGTFSVKLYSRLVYEYDANNILEPGDIIEANDDNSTQNPSFLSRFPQKPGRAQIKDIVDIRDEDVIEIEIKVDTTEEKIVIGPGVGTDTLITIMNGIADTQLVNLDTIPASIDSTEVEKKVTKKVVEAKIIMLNDKEGGTFTYNVTESKIFIVDGPGGPVEEIIFQGYKNVPLTFGSDSVKVVDFGLHDYFEIEDVDGNLVVDDVYRVSEFNEVLLKEYGVSLQMAHGYDPSYEVFDRLGAGFLGAKIIPASQDWLRPVMNSEDPSEGVSWLNYRGEGVRPQASDKDPVNVYSTIQDGSIAPYIASKRYNPSSIDGTGGGAQYGSGSTTVDYYALPNIDVVITDDQSKWTRCPVIQVELKEGQTVTNGTFNMVKSAKPSVGKNGNPDGSVSPIAAFGASKGMGWFPGYAINLDNGQRLNMMFAESRKLDPTNGDNLKWEPTSDVHGGRSYIYVMSSMYDESLNKYEQIFDDAEAKGGAINFLDGTVKVYEDAAWVLNLRKAVSQPLFSGDYAIKVRVDHSYKTTKADNFIPTYEFSLDKYVPEFDNDSAAASALDLIRAVPNPYYAYSEYETNQLSNLIYLTNLPNVCKISIYNISGTLVKVFNKNSDAPYLEWDLKNDFGVPIASGAYIIHIDAKDIGQKTIKWFGILRPLDLDTF